MQHQEPKGAPLVGYATVRATLASLREDLQGRRR